MSTAQATATDAPKEEKAAKTASASTRKMPMKFKLLLIISSLAMMVFLRTGFIFVCIAMMPSIVAYYIDRAKRRYLFKTVFALNLSGTMPFIGRMVMEGPGSALQSILQNVDTWVVIYGSAICGYMMVMIMPIITHVLFSRFHVVQVVRIEETLKKIESEWGDEVTKFSKKPDADE